MLRTLADLASTRVVLNAPRKVRACKKAKLRVRLAGVGTGSVVIRDGRKLVRTVTVKGRATEKRRLRPASTGCPRRVPAARPASRRPQRSGLGI
jgi:hypothetical protein